MSGKIQRLVCRNIQYFAGFVNRSSEDLRTVRMLRPNCKAKGRTFLNSSMQSEQEGGELLIEGSSESVPCLPPPPTSWSFAAAIQVALPLPGSAVEWPRAH
eukprot:766759-Hanusia_phi.AAC.1